MPGGGQGSSQGMPSLLCQLVAQCGLGFLVSGLGHPSSVVHDGVGLTSGQIWVGHSYKLCAAIALACLLSRTSV